MKRLCLLFFLFLMLFELKAQRWSGDDNQTGLISRTGHTSVGRLFIGVNNAPNTPDINLAAQGVIAGPSNLFFVIDSDNNDVNRRFEIGKNFTGIGQDTENGQTYQKLFSIGENGFGEIRGVGGLRFLNAGGTKQGRIVHNSAGIFGLFNSNEKWAFKTHPNYTRIGVNGADQIYINSNGRVGIGTAYPAQKFTVNGGRIMSSSTAPGIEFKETDRNVTWRNLISGDKYFVQRNGATKLSINSDGHALVKRLFIGVNNAPNTPDINLEGQGVIAGPSNLFLIMDSDNNDTDTRFEIGKNFTGIGQNANDGQTYKKLFRISENGSTSISSLEHNSDELLPLYVDKSGKIVRASDPTVEVQAASTSSAPNSIADWKLTENSTSSYLAAGNIANFDINDRLTNQSMKGRAFAYFNGNESDNSNFPIGDNPNFVLNGGNGHGYMAFETDNPQKVAQMGFVNLANNSMWSMSHRGDWKSSGVGGGDPYDLYKDRFTMSHLEDYGDGDNVNIKHRALQIYRNGQVVLANEDAYPYGVVGAPFGDAPAPNLDTNPFEHYRLSVRGSIACEEITIQEYSNWADYVFEDDYKLAELDDVEKYISENGHLPNIPSAEEIEKDGLHTGDMLRRQMEKIEELTLYTIEQEDKINTLESMIMELKSVVSKINDSEKSTLNN